MIEKLKFLFRKKRLTPIVRDVEYHKTLGLFDIIAIGLSCSLNGIYVMIGHSIKFESGPAIIFSFLIAGLSIFLSGYCFCELAARVSSNGAAYSYMYLTFGELLAFCMGWIYILQFIIAISSDARALSANIDALFSNRISNMSTFPVKIDMHGFSEYPDFLAFFIIALNTALLIFGIKESSFLNKIINLTNVTIIVFIIIFGFVKADVQNWNIKNIGDENVNRGNGSIKNGTVSRSEEFGLGGFAPYGLNGILNTASKCVYAFVGEECRNPKRDIPKAIILTVVLLCICFVLLSAVLSLMIPYYEINELAPFPAAFELNYRSIAIFDVNIFKVLITISVLLSIFVSIYGEMYVVTRILCTIASDGLVFRFLENLCKKFKTPVNATLLTCILSGVFAIFVTLEELIEILSMGALTAYSVVSICVVILRYEPSNEEIDDTKSETTSMTTTSGESLASQSWLQEMFAPDKLKPDRRTKKIVNSCVLFAILVMISICILCRLMNDGFKFAYFVWICVLFATLSVATVVIWKQPQSENKSLVKILFLPITPFLSFLINFYLILTLSYMIWLIVTAWMIIGLFIYAIYGVRHSAENKNSNKFKFHHQTSLDKSLIKLDNLTSLQRDL